MKKIKITKKPDFPTPRKRGDLEDLQVGEGELVLLGSPPHGYLFLCPFKGKDCECKAVNHFGDGRIYLPHKMNQKWRDHYKNLPKDSWEHREDENGVTLTPSMGATPTCLACKRGERKACHFSITNSELVEYPT